MEFLGVSPGVVTREQFCKISGVVFVIVVYMAQHIHHPVAEVHIGSLAAPQQRVHDCSILGSVMVTAKKVILSTQGQASQAVFGEIIVNAVSAIQVVTCQTVVDVISVLYLLGRTFSYSRTNHFSKATMMG